MKILLIGVINMENEFDFRKIVEMVEYRRNNAYRKINEELISLYWDFGKYVSDMSKTSNWGDLT